MENARMMTLIPAHMNESTRESTKPLKKDDTRKQRNLLQIALKIAEVGGYDEDLRIKSTDGNIIRDSDVIGLIQHSLSPMRSTKGLNEFVDMLHRSGIDPDLIKNIQVKEMLNKKSQSSGWKRPVLDDVKEPFLLAVPGDVPKETLQIRGTKKPRRKETPVKFLMSLRNEKKLTPSKGMKRKIAESHGNKRHKSKLWDDNDSDLD